VCLQAVRAFFRTNRVTCVEWVLRVRLLLVGIAQAAGQHATVLHHAYLLLQVSHTTLGYG
jgi:PI-3-kinase-related kinase SMG-1